MIEVNVKEEEKTVEKIKFPVLMRSINLNLIVLFTKDREGTCLKIGSSTLDIGQHSCDWASCYNNSIWEKYEGEITLKNK